VKPPTPPMVAKADQGEIAARQAREAAKRQLADIYFAFDKWALSSEGIKNLAQSAELLKQTPTVKVLIEGHCDERAAVNTTWSWVRNGPRRPGGTSSRWGSRTRSPSPVMGKNVLCAPSPTSPAIGRIAGRTLYWRVRDEKHNGLVRLQRAGLGADLRSVRLRDQGDEQQNDPTDD